jgi:hypothetical protein
MSETVTNDMVLPNHISADDWTKAPMSVKLNYINSAKLEDFAVEPMGETDLIQAFARIVQLDAYFKFKGTVLLSRELKVAELVDEISLLVDKAIIDGAV